MLHLKPIEGLRAYLAFWVVACHVLWASGYRDQLTGLTKLIGNGEYAVDAFVIVSGFVIFLLLDKQKESYLAFVTRRFFRLFPVFFVLFLLAIPTSKLLLWNVAHASRYWQPAHALYMTSRIESWWQNLNWHIPLHLLMLHGAVPQALLPDAPGAFLDPAWSISLEWQFYLVAPLAYALAVRAAAWRRLALCAISIIVVAAAPRLPAVMYGAFLPFHLEFFLVGIASYFFYKRCADRTAENIWLPSCCVVAVCLFSLGERSWPLIPVGFWLVVLGLLLENPKSLSSRLASPFLTPPWVQYLGRISYSVYLSHMLVIIVVQHVLLLWAPDLGMFAHFWALLALSVGATVGVSVLLYHVIEVPGIALGRSLVARLHGAPAPRQENLAGSAVRRAFLAFLTFLFRAIVARSH